MLKYPSFLHLIGIAGSDAKSKRRVEDRDYEQLLAETVKKEHTES